MPHKLQSQTLTHPNACTQDMLDAMNAVKQTQTHPRPNACTQDMLDAMNAVKSTSPGRGVAAPVSQDGSEAGRCACLL